MDINEWLKNNNDNIQKLSDAERIHLLDYLESHKDILELKNLPFEEILLLIEEWDYILSGENDDSGCNELLTRLDEKFALYKILDGVSRFWESKHMNHCIKNYKDSDDLYSVRDFQTNIPVCTMEIKNSEIIQIKGYGNKGVSIKFVDAVIKALEFLKVKIGTEDMINLGFVEFGSEEVGLLKECVSPVRAKTINGGYYVSTDTRFSIKDESLLELILNKGIQTGRKKLYGSLFTHNENRDFLQRLSRLKIKEDIWQELLYNAIVLKNKPNTEKIFDLVNKEKISSKIKDFSSINTMSRIRLILSADVKTLSELKMGYSLLFGLHEVLRHFSKSEHVEKFDYILDSVIKEYRSLNISGAAVTMQTVSTLENISVERTYKLVEFAKRIMTRDVDEKIKMMIIKSEGETLLKYLILMNADEYLEFNKVYSCDDLLIKDVCKKIYKVLLKNKEYIKMFPRLMRYSKKNTSVLDRIVIRWNNLKERYQKNLVQIKES